MSQLPLDLLGLVAKVKILEFVNYAHVSHTRFSQYWHILTFPVKTELIIKRLAWGYYLLSDMSCGIKILSTHRDHCKAECYSYMSEPREWLLGFLQAADGDCLSIHICKPLSALLSPSMFHMYPRICPFLFLEAYSFLNVPFGTL